MLPIVIVATVAIVLALLAMSRSPSPEHDAVGKPAPDVDLVRLDDDLNLPPVTPPHDETVLLHFWGTWCPPCQREYPQLAAMASRYDDSDRFRFLPVTCEAQPDTFDNLWAETSGYFRRNAIESPAYADPRGLTRRSTAERLDQPSLYYPTSVLIDTRGNIAGVWEGYKPGTVEEIETTLRDMLDH